MYFFVTVVVGIYQRIAFWMASQVRRNPFVGVPIIGLYFAALGVIFPMLAFRFEKDFEPLPALACLMGIVFGVPVMIFLHEELDPGVIRRTFVTAAVLLPIIALFLLLDPLLS